MSVSARLERATRWLALAGYALVASGLPLPLGLLAPPDAAVADVQLAGKDRSRPFPCMDKPCGCATAEQCFTNCCCHTPAERLAWAKAHAVEPAVLAALARRVATEVVKAQPAGGCCAAAAKPEPACCGSGGCDDSAPSAPATDEPDVCADFQSLAAESPRPDADPAPAVGRPRTVTLQSMLACGGIITSWLAVGGSLPPPRVEFAVDPPLVAVCICGDLSAGGLPAAPALPPPRAD